MTHYDEFGLAPTASAEEIHRAHRNLVRLLHPDPIQDEEVRRLAEGQLKRLNTIYSVLIDPARRRSYDMQLTRHRPVGEVASRPPTRKVIRWEGPALVAAISLMAGFQAAVWWGELNVKERLVYVDRSEPDSSAPAVGSTVRPDAQPLLADTRELRRMLNQVISERDQALARLGSLRSVGPALPAASAGVSLNNAPRAANPDPPRPLATGTVAETQQEAPKTGRTGLAGTWIYSVPAGRAALPDQYAAEYIELLITERESRLWGRYRGRYKVPDRALSPEVEFFFEGPSAGDRRYSWKGNGGSAGEVHLGLLSENSLSLDWFTVELGRIPMLGSGTAVLVRRRQE
jgi:hypothetical protein